MRLLSRIIKNSDLVVSHPKIIEFFDTTKWKEEIEENTGLKLEAEKQEKEIQSLQEESEKILAETEKIVLEILEKARLEAKEILNIAQEDADVLREKANEEAILIREKAQNEGCQEGLKKAENEIENDRQLAIKRNQMLIEEARKNKLEIIRSTEADIVRLVMAVAKKVIVSEIQIHPEIIVDITRQAIEYLDHPDNVKVHVNPDEMKYLLDAIESEGLVDSIDDDVEINIKADKRISKGGCVIDSSNGSVDARYETRFENVENAISEVIGNE